MHDLLGEPLTMIITYRVPPSPISMNMSHQERTPVEHLRHRLEGERLSSLPTFAHRASEANIESRQDAAFPRYLKPVPTDEPLIDISGGDNALGRQSKTIASDDQNRCVSSSVHDFLQVQEGRINSFLQHSEKRAEAQRSALQHVVDNLSNSIIKFGNSRAHRLGHPAANQVAQFHGSLRLPVWTKPLANEEFQELFIYAYLWVVVDEQVFKARGMIRGGHVLNFKEMREDLIAPNSQAHLFDTLQDGVLKAERSLGISSSMIKRLLRAWQAVNSKDFSHFVVQPPKTHHTDFLREMEGIIETALDLDEILMNTRAIVIVRWLKRVQLGVRRYNPDIMDAVANEKELSHKSLVNFEVSPMLLKFGNADSWNYDSRMVLCKALVV
ncbi:hypothetical protein FBEOM_1395 [Fusarium beomiforme]|uniref:Uncharacterized protein n=1 Tax=Fusarium beomiforme TaxID=44412 RepID=A0A9P5E4J0_9HYPO|nr:hypothetical protein FBEOM_1395 [Fusarium beomiforme]